MPSTDALPSSSSTSSAQTSNGKRHQVKSACVPCTDVKKKCNLGRPCERCIKMNIQHECVDREKKRRKQKQSDSINEKQDEEEEEEAGRDANNIPLEVEASISTSAAASAVPNNATRSTPYYSDARPVKEISMAPLYAEIPIVGDEQGRCGVGPLYLARKPLLTWLATLEDSDPRKKQLSQEIDHYTLPLETAIEIMQPTRTYLRSCNENIRNLAQFMNDSLDMALAAHPMPFKIHRTDDKGCGRTFFNQAYCELFKIPPEELVRQFRQGHFDKLYATPEHIIRSTEALMNARLKSESCCVITGELIDHFGEKFVATEIVKDDYGPLGVILGHTQLILKGHYDNNISIPDTLPKVCQTFSSNVLASALTLNTVVIEEGEEGDQQ